MINVQKLRDAMTLLEEVDARFEESGMYDDETGLASAFALKNLIEDLDIDIDRLMSDVLD